MAPFEDGELLAQGKSLQAEVVSRPNEPVQVCKERKGESEHEACWGIHPSGL